MEIKIVLFMLLMHIIDDFVLQPICLSKLKQKEWWKSNIPNEYGLYSQDYKCALLMHSISWSIMTLIPIMAMLNISNFILALIFVINVVIHYITDDYKANKLKINLWTDQSIHLLQILLTWSIAIML